MQFQTIHLYCSLRQQFTQTVDTTQLIKNIKLIESCFDIIIIVCTQKH